MLQRFFGLVRGACGANTHPEAKTFAHLFRLLIMHSLVKPIKGSNITGGQLLESLFKREDFQKMAAEQRKEELERRLDDILQNGKLSWKRQNYKNPSITSQN